jgi:hypothetical protein
MTHFNPNHCWYNLDVDTSHAINENFEWPVVDKNGRNMIWQYSDPSKIFSQTWLDSVKSIGLDLGSVMLFWRPSRFRNIDAHVDVSTKDPAKFATAALNIVINGRGSTMLWYKKPEGEHEIKWTMAKTPYLTWPVKDLEEIERKEIGMALTMVRVDVPHAIYCSDEDRWCISARFRQQFPDWETAVKAMNYRGVLVPR